MKTKHIIIAIRCLALLLTIGIPGATAQPQVMDTLQQDVAGRTEPDRNDSASIVDSIINAGKKYLGKPYRYRLADGKSLDCSGFIAHIYGEYGIPLPHSSASIAGQINRISLKDAQKGDLMIFKGRNSGSNSVGHVSMITGVDGENIEMMHSCNRGIIVENYNANKYYTSRLLFAGRLPNMTMSVPAIADTTAGTPVHPKPADAQPAVTADTLPGKRETIKIIGVGDMMLGTNYPGNSYLPPNDGKDILQPVKQLIRKGDVAFGNLEGVILTGEGTVKKCSDPKVCYAFKMPDHYVNHFVDAGFNLLSVANNHVRDFGSTGTTNTMRILKEAGIHFAGLAECPYTTFTKDGITYGFAAFSPNSGTVKIHDYANARKIIARLDSLCDIVIVSFHGGAEGPTKKHITRQAELFLGENRGNPYEFARMAIDAGADIVLGHGPHVTRAIDLYKDRFIAYSLGNFATYGRFSLSGPNGISPIVELDVDRTGKFISGHIHSTKQLGEGGPVPDPAVGALKEIITLTSTDIPECPLMIGQDGRISRRSR